MTQVFLSHATADDALVRRLQQALALQGVELWIDSRQIVGGDPLWPVVQAGIEDADAYAVLVSPAALQSRWVGKELRHALTVQGQRGRERYPVIPLSLDGTQLGVLEDSSASEPTLYPHQQRPRRHRRRSARHPGRARQAPARGRARPSPSPPPSPSRTWSWN